MTESQEVIYWHEFQYDGVGNMVKKLDLTTTPATVLAEYEHNAADQITNTGFSYDDRGNMVEESRPESDEDWDYTYDSQNRLLTASDGTNNYAYEYDGDGNRVKQTVNQIVTEFVVDTSGGLSQVAADINSGGNVKVLYVRGDDLISQEQDADRYHYSYDGHGSTVALTDDQGAEQKYYEYDAWGNMRGTDDTGRLNRFRYTGQQEDGTELYYLRARYYGPEIARFGARDPAVGSPEDPRTLHLYCYCVCDPANWADPAGADRTLAARLVVMAIGAILGAVYYVHVVSSDPLRRFDFFDLLYYMAGGALVALAAYYLIGWIVSIVRGGVSIFAAGGTGAVTNVTLRGGARYWRLGRFYIQRAMARFWYGASAGRSADRSRQLYRQLSRAGWTRRHMDELAEYILNTTPRMMPSAQTTFRVSTGIRDPYVTEFLLPSRVTGRYMYRCLVTWRPLPAGSGAERGALEMGTIILKGPKG